MELNELVRVLQDKGVVGAGGAGFPTYAKISDRAEIIILNCAECEPLLKLHQQLLKKEALKICKAFSLIAGTVKAKEAVIAIKRGYRDTIRALEHCLQDFPDIRLVFLDEVYPAGDELVLIYEVTGIGVEPGSLPIDKGVTVFNVETVYNVYRAVMEDKPVTDKLVTIVGEVEHPVTLRLPLGMSAGEGVAYAGGSRIPNPVYFMGGPMMGTIGGPQTPITKTTNGILLLPEDHYLVRRKQSKSSVSLKRAAACCCQCNMCTDLCPRHLLGHPIEPHKFMQAAICKNAQETEVFLNTFFCSSCGVCELFSCPQGLSPRSLIGEYKTGLRSAGVRQPQGVEGKPVPKERKYRKVPMERLKARLNLTRYDREAPLDNETRMGEGEVKILLSQHIGAPGVPAVKPGEQVSLGQVIGRAGEGLSVAVHASVSGTVAEATEKAVRIQYKK